MRLIKSSSAVAGLLTLIVVVAACVTLVFCSPSTAGQDDKLEQQQPSASSIQLPALFDFKHYQQVFKKKYGSKLEEARRWTYYWANLVKVYIAGIAFKFRRQSYYLAVNEMSDWSPEELNQMEVNKGMADQSIQEDKELTPPDSDNLEIIRETELQGDINASMEEANSMRGLLPEINKLRKKREIESEQVLKPRELSLDMMMQSDEPELQPDEELEKSDEHSNSDNDDRAQTEPSATKVSIGQLEILTPHRPKFSQEISGGPGMPQWNSLLQDAGKAWNSLFIKPEPNGRANDGRSSDLIGEGERGDGTQEMFVDLRQTGCVSEPRRQRTCGACYAFAAITMAEFIFCNQTKKLTAFSEQYLVDCGPDRLPGMDGCEGSYPSLQPNFIHNFGLELASYYPYVGRSMTCPYDEPGLREKTNQNSIGFIRMALDGFARVPVTVWHVLVQKTPIYASIRSPADFSLYGGAVHDGHNCRENAPHAMVLVGHGRQDGQEFWLLKNSYGTHWGEKGYFKLAKSAPKRCFVSGVGFVYGTTDGFNYKFNIKINELNGKALLNRLKAKKAEQTEKKGKTVTVS